MGAKQKKWKFYENYNHEIFGVHPVIHKAPEPSNINWENYSISEGQRMFRKAVAYSIIILLLLFIYVFAFKFSIKGS
jgi:hypothetical protein